MARKAYVGDTDGTPLLIPKGYIGGNDGKPIRLLKGYVGDKDGLARLFWGGQRTITFIYTRETHFEGDPSEYVSATLPDGRVAGIESNEIQSVGIYFEDTIRIYARGPRYDQSGYVYLNGTLVKDSTEKNPYYDYKVTKPATIELIAAAPRIAGGSGSEQGEVRITETE